MSHKTAIITGAGGAIAAHVIAAFDAAGWNLVLVTHGDAEHTRMQSAHADACVVQANLADADDTAQTLRKALSRCGPVGALLNIAGGFDMSSALDTTPAQLDAQLDINLRTAFNATCAVLPHMLEHGGGFVLGVGAGQAIDGGASCGTYAAAKAAMIAWMKSMHAELAPKGIEMGIVYPMGAVDTAGNREAMPDVDPSTWIDPAELADTMLHLASRSARGHVREARVYPPT